MNSGAHEPYRHLRKELTHIDANLAIDRVGEAESTKPCS